MGQQRTAVPFLRWGNFVWDKTPLLAAWCGTARCAKIFPYHTLEGILSTWKAPGVREHIIHCTSFGSLCFARLNRVSPTFAQISPRKGEKWHAARNWSKAVVRSPACADWMPYDCQPTDSKNIQFCYNQPICLEVEKNIEVRRVALNEYLPHTAQHQEHWLTNTGEKAPPYEMLTQIRLVYVRN